MDEAIVCLLMGLVNTYPLLLLAVCRVLMENQKDAACVSYVTTYLENVFPFLNLHLLLFIASFNNHLKGTEKLKKLNLKTNLAFLSLFSDVLLQNVHKNGEMEAQPFCLVFPEVVYQLSAVACEVINVIRMSDKSDNLSELEMCCVLPLKMIWEAMCFEKKSLCVGRALAA